MITCPGGSEVSETDLNLKTNLYGWSGDRSRTCGNQICCGDRSRLGSKHTLLVDANGVPLVIHTAPANARDYKLILPVVEDFPEIGGKPGRPRNHPAMIYADRGYDSEAIRQSLRSQVITPVIARRGIDRGSSLGRIRWVVERTISWFKGLRRLRIRYDRSDDVQDAWNRLAASVLCYRIASRWGICPG